MYNDVIKELANQLHHEQKMPAWEAIETAEELIEMIDSDNPMAEAMCDEYMLDITDIEYMMQDIAG